MKFSLKTILLGLLALFVFITFLSMPVMAQVTSSIEVESVTPFKGEILVRTTTVKSKCIIKIKGETKHVVGSWKIYIVPMDNATTKNVKVLMCIRYNDGSIFEVESKEADMPIKQLQNLAKAYEGNR